MGLFSSIKEAEEKALHIVEDAARKMGQKLLRKAALAYSDAKAAMHVAAQDVEVAKARLEKAMAKAAEQAETARVLAEEAARHALAEADRLAIEARHAADEAEHRASHVLAVTAVAVEKKVEPKVEIPSAETTYKI